ncbi:nitroreductase family protein [Desulfosporosinus sp.]|uniref:nitroreductase family protein n=1 Tax=Desulfosporosinus sp. TaxID=157907 RepID=UPI0025BE04CC|nr:nitroreductase family protein [Desulfosporosinus sp.]MBC2727719.1 nitroreductase family protein [Desulfosporosinus sp.]
MTNFRFFKTPITEIIKKRISVRTYSEQPLTSDIKETLLEFFAISKGPFGTPVRYNLIERNLARSRSNAKLGTYGVIRGASTYVVAVVEKADKDLEDFGYSLENAILFATSLGLGTCWLGGTFKKSEFSKAIEQKEHEILPCISPIGYPSSKRSLIDTAMRFTAGSKNRKEWGELFFSGEFGRPLSIEEAGKYETPLEMVRLAPSASNKQPWRVVKTNNILHFYLQHTKGYAKLLAYDLQRVDMGIAMCHFELTTKELGINGCWCVCDPGNIGKPQDTEYVVSWIESV